MIAADDETAEEEEAEGGGGSDSVCDGKRQETRSNVTLSCNTCTDVRQCGGGGGGGRGRSIRREIDPSQTSFHRRQINQVRNGPRCRRDKKQSRGAGGDPGKGAAATTTALPLGSVVSRRTRMIPATICFQE